MTCVTWYESSTSSKYLDGWLQLNYLNVSEEMVNNFCWWYISCIYNLFKQYKCVAKNTCIPSFLGSLDVVKTLDEYPKVYKVLCILLVLWDIIQGSVKHSQLKLLQKHC